jgi:hypothetical protein
MITISELKRLNTQNGGFFFSNKTMKFFSDSMRGFRLENGPDSQTVTVIRKKNGMKWNFSLESGRMIH